MKLIKYFINNKIVIYALTILAILLGLNYYLKLPVTALPPIAPQSLLISTSYQNAAPLFMEEEVTTPIETAIDNIKGIDTVRSVSSLGTSHIHVSFKYATNIARVTQDIKNTLSLVRDKLPKNVEEPVVTLDDNQDANAIMYIGIYSDTKSEAWLSSYFTHNFESKLNQIPGVGDVNVLGSQDQAINISLKLGNMANYKITFGQIKQALEDRNVSVEGGTVHNDAQEYGTVVL